MGQTHTIAVRFPEGVVPRYSAATEFQGGQVVAVDFDGNRLTVAQELEEALEDLVEMLDGTPELNLGSWGIDTDDARAALAGAKKATA